MDRYIVNFRSSYFLICYSGWHSDSNFKEAYLKHKSSAMADGITIKYCPPGLPEY